MGKGNVAGAGVVGSGQSLSDIIDNILGCKPEPGVSKKAQQEHCRTQRQAAVEYGADQAGYDHGELGPHRDEFSRYYAGGESFIGLRDIDTGAGHGRGANISVGKKSHKIYPLVFGPVPLKTKKP